MSWLADLAREARSAMPEALWHHVQAGAGSGVAAAEAESAWQDVRFAPRVLRDVSSVDLTTSLLGSRVATPVGVAPTSLQRLAHPEGELAMARGAEQAGALHVVSSNAGHPFAALEATGPWWLQAYLPPRRADLLPVLAAAAAAGASAVVLTVDTPFPGAREQARPDTWEDVDLSWFRCNFQTPGDERWARDLGPGDLEWLGRTSGLPVVVKGVLRADDARRCVSAGAAAVWVSNHGGRQLDRALATRHALPRVLAEIGTDAEVYVDGGIRSGADALAALALGARGVFLGRLPLLGLASGGAAGVVRVLDRITTELGQALALAGCASPSDTPGIAVSATGNPC